MPEETLDETMERIRKEREPFVARQKELDAMAQSMEWHEILGMLRYKINRMSYLDAPLFSTSYLIKQLNKAVNKVQRYTEQYEMFKVVGKQVHTKGEQDAA